MSEVRRGPTVLAVLAVVVIAACTGHHDLARAAPGQFSDLDAITAHARDLAATAGDPQPRAVSIVKSTRAAVFGPDDSDSTRGQELYFIRMEGDFKRGGTCHHPAGAAPLGPTRWMSFDWDPLSHSSMDFSYGSAPHLEEFGTVYAIDLHSS